MTAQVDGAAAALLLLAAASGAVAAARILPNTLALADG